MMQIDGFIMFGFTYGYKYTGGPFIYCPWCGKQIKDADLSPSPEEVKTDSTTYTTTM